MIGPQTILAVASNVVVIHGPTTMQEEDRCKFYKSDTYRNLRDFVESRWNDDAEKTQRPSE